MPDTVRHCILNLLVNTVEVFMLPCQLALLALYSKFKKNKIKIYIYILQQNWLWMTYYNSIFIFSLCDFSLSSCLLNTHNCCFRSQLAVSDEWHRAVHLSIIHCSFLTCLNGFVFFLFFTCPAAIDAILSKWVIKRIVDASQWWSRGADCDIVLGGRETTLS